MKHFNKFLAVASGRLALMAKSRITLSSAIVVLCFVAAQGALLASLEARYAASGPPYARLQSAKLTFAKAAFPHDEHLGQFPLFLFGVLAVALVIVPAVLVLVAAATHSRDERNGDPKRIVENVFAEFAALWALGVALVSLSLLLACSLSRAFSFPISWADLARDAIRVAAVAAVSLLPYAAVLTAARSAFNRRIAVFTAGLAFVATPFVVNQMKFLPKAFAWASPRPYVDYLMSDGKAWIGVCGLFLATAACLGFAVWVGAARNGIAIRLLSPFHRARLAIPQRGAGGNEARP